MTMLATINNGRVIGHHQGGLDEVNYGSGSPDENITVPFPDWAFELRQANMAAGNAQRILTWDYESKTFSITTPEVDWEVAREVYLEQIRGIRNKLLHYTDWVETTDRIDPSVKDEVMNYRDALRNFTSSGCLVDTISFKEWCEAHQREPLPLEFLPEQSDIVKTFYIGHKIVL